MSETDEVMVANGDIDLRMEVTGDGPTIVCVHSSTSARVGAGACVKWRFNRSAQSWMGVRGFLIS